MLIFLLLILFSTTESNAKENLFMKDTTFVLSGYVYDREEGKALQSVTVRVAALHVGTFTKSDGSFNLRLMPGKHTIMFSMVGREKFIMDIDLTKDSYTNEIFLKSSSSMTEAVVVIAEDPGERIMRQVNERKQSFKDSLQTYTYMLYTKFSAATDSSTAGRSEDKTDTTIVSIFESYSKGYFKAPDSYFNEIIQRRQSQNIPPSSNFVTFGTNTNSYEDIVTVLGEKIATPFYPDAHDFYEFILDEKYFDPENRMIARILAYPKSRTRKMFTGILLIDTLNLIPKYVELSPTQAVQLPFSAILRFKQTFTFIDSTFVMPKELDLFGSAEANILWLMTPRLDIRITTRAYDYEINQPIPNSYFNRRRVEAAATASEFDSTFWKRNDFGLLSPKEIQAYESIRLNMENPDSALRQNLFNEYFGVVARTISRLDRKPFTGFEDVISYNRVQGLYLGMGLRTPLTDGLYMQNKFGYGFADDELYGQSQLQYYFDELEQFSVYSLVHKSLNRSDELSQLRKPTMSLVTLFSGRDYGDYFYAQGFEFGVEAGIGQLVFLRRDNFFRPKRIKLYFKSDKQMNADINSTFSIFGKGVSRDNPRIIEGNMNSIGMEMNWDYHSRRRFSESGFQLAAEISNKAIGSNFDFTRFHGVFFVRFQTMPSWLADFRIMGGYSLGKVPPQKFFSLESSTSGIASAISLRALNVKEFYGSEFFIASFEHNFGELIPGILRIPSVAAFGIEFITFGRLAFTDFGKDAIFASDSVSSFIPPTTAATSDNYYYETGIGLNKILIFFRIDLTARLSQRSKPQFILTFTNASF